MRTGNYRKLAKKNYKNRFEISYCSGDEGVYRCNSTTTIVLGVLRAPVRIDVLIIENKVAAKTFNYTVLKEKHYRTPS